MFLIRASRFEFHSTFDFRHSTVDFIVMNGNSLLRTFSVARKELLHILRDPQTLFFTIFIPVLELFMLGYAIDTNVRNVRTVIVDQAGTQESRQLLEKFEKSQDFRVVRQVWNDQDASELIVAGKDRK